MINVSQNGDVYEIKFKYDPILNDIIKSIAGRRWNPEIKCWTIPANKLGFFLNRIKGTDYEHICNVFSNEDIGINCDMDVTDNIPNIDISNIPFYVRPGDKPFNHQLDFLKYAINRERIGRPSFIVGDDMGLGKTIESLNIALYDWYVNSYQHCLIICNINTSKYNWKDEIESITCGSMEGYILGSRIRRDKSVNYDGSGKDKVYDLKSGTAYKDANHPLPYFLICNVESLRIKEGRKYTLSDVIIEYINSGRINMIIIDEVHKNMSPTSVQGKQILRIKDATRDKCKWLPMTGTIIVRKPTDAFLPLKLVNGHSFKSYYTWNQYFCVYGGYGNHEILGYKNIPKLKTMLQDNMIRRLKTDKLDLPPKLYFTEYVDNTSYQDKLYQAIRDRTLSDISRSNVFDNYIAKFLRLRQVNGSPELVDTSLSNDDPKYLSHNAKLKRLLEILEDIHERGEKVIVFSNWVEPLRMIYKYVSKKYKVCCFTGTMSAEVRQKHKLVFQNNPKYTVLLGTIGAAGTTHTFTAANNIIFYDEPWNATDKCQAEDRAYRIGTHGSLNIYTLLCKNTVDEHVHKILFDKSATAKYVVDNQLDFKKDPNLVYKLLGKIE